MTTPSCSYRQRPGSPQICVALPDPRSRTGLCAGHRAMARKAAADEYGRRITISGQATADAWARHEGWEVDELRAVLDGLPRLKVRP